jgi:hypothetical protein
MLDVAVNWSCKLVVRVSQLVVRVSKLEVRVSKLEVKVSQLEAIWLESWTSE